MVASSQVWYKQVELFFLAFEQELFLAARFNLLLFSMHGGSPKSYFYQ